MQSERKPRILLAKAGLDAHVRGISILMKRLRDAGMEIIYSGPYQTPESIVAAAVQEDVDFIFLSSHLSGHIALSEQIMKLLKDNGAGHIRLAVGGMIPSKDFPALKAIGVTRAFLPLTLPSVVIDFINREMASNVGS